MPRKESEKRAYKSSGMSSVLFGTTDESFYETSAAKEMMQILIEMSREKKKL